MFSKKRITFTISLLVVVLMLFYALGAQAISLGDVKIIATDGGLFTACSGEGQGFVCILTTVLQILLSLAFILAVIFVVISGYRFITSQGNEESVTKAKKNLTWAIAGIVLIVLAWIILAVIVRTVQTGSPGTPASSNSGQGPSNPQRSRSATDPGGAEFIE